jgi:hypothetical protein
MTAQAYDLLMQRDDLRRLFTRKDDYRREKVLEHQRRKCVEMEYET